jgi:hypothetical protein
MSMKDLMLEQLEVARRIVSDGQNVPAWRIEFARRRLADPDKVRPGQMGQSDRALHVGGSWAWKFAPAFGPRVIHTWQEVH